MSAGIHGEKEEERKQGRETHPSSVTIWCLKSWLARPCMSYWMTFTKSLEELPLTSNTLPAEVRYQPNVMAQLRYQPLACVFGCSLKLPRVGWH